MSRKSDIENLYDDLDIVYAAYTKHEMPLGEYRAMKQSIGTEIIKLQEFPE